MSRIVACFLLVFLPSTNVWSDPSYDGLIVSQITIERDNIFDTRVEEEDGLLQRASNRLHILTRESVIKNQLLIHEGDAFSQQLMEESERILRSNRYLRAATILAYEVDGSIHLTVITKDTWSTKPKVNFSRKGGSNNSELGLQEENLLGKGIQLGLYYKSTIDRSSSTLKYLDKNAFKNRHSLYLEFSNNSDGYVKTIDINKPYYSFTSDNSSGFSISTEQREDKLYFRSKKYHTFDTINQSIQAFFGKASIHQDYALRHNIGIEYTSNEYSNGQIQLPLESEYVSSFIANHPLLPKDNEETLIYYQIDYLENSYKKVFNFEKIERVEDLYTGLNMGLKLGYSSKSIASDTTHLSVESYINKYMQLSEESILLSSLTTEMEIDDDNIYNALALYSVQYHKSQSNQFKFYAKFSGSYSHKLDWERQNFLNGEEGLRGYPLNYLSATETQSLTVEQRYFSTFNPWKIFNMGAAVFIDIGRASGGNTLEKIDNGVYKNIGFGLRISNNRTSVSDLIHIDFSFPQDVDENSAKFQIQIESKTTF